jgi:hypothetical protein
MFLHLLFTKYKYLWLPIVTFVLMIAYWPGIEAPATTLRWMMLYAFLPFVRVINLEKVFVFASYGIAINSLICLGQWFHWNLSIDGKGYYNTDIAYWIVNLSWRPSGLFVNGNILAETTALVIVGCITYRKWFHVLPMIPAMLLPMQRASILALVIVGTIWIFQNQKLKLSRYMVLILLLSIGGVIFLMRLDLSSFRDRFELWSFAASNLHWLGNGIGSFRTDYLNYTGFADTNYNVIYIHNDYLELIYDLGIFGVCIIMAFTFTLFSNCKVKYVLWTFAIIACFGFPSHMPATLFIATLCIIECLRNWSDNSLLLRCSRIPAFPRDVQRRFIPIRDGY